MNQIGLHSVDGGRADSDPASNAGRAEGESSALLDDRDCQSRKMEALGRLAAGRRRTSVATETRVHERVSGR